MQCAVIFLKRSYNTYEALHLRLKEPSRKQEGFTTKEEKKPISYVTLIQGVYSNKWYIVSNKWYIVLRSLIAYYSKQVY